MLNLYFENKKKWPNAINIWVMLLKNDPISSEKPIPIFTVFTKTDK